MDFASPRYSSAPMASLSGFSPSARSSAKRTRSRTFSTSHDEPLGGADLDWAAYRARSTVGSSSYPTPPLSASSSISSSNSSMSSLCAGSGPSQQFPSFASFPWRPESVGPPMAMQASPEIYTPAPDGHLLDLADLRACAAGRPGKPRARSVFSEPPPSATQGILPTPIPLDAARFLAHKAIDDHPAHHFLPPRAPALEQQQLELNPMLDSLKPWLQQEYVEGLIGVSMLAIEAIWPTQTAAQKAKPGSPVEAPPGSPDQVLPLKYFIQETLRRSRSSAIVLQVALYYLHKSRSRIRERVAKAEAAKDRFAHLARLRQQAQQHAAYPTPPASPLLDDFAAAAADVLATSKDPAICGRRMFLAALISASKFLLDRTYSNRAWSRLSGLSVAEINANERAFLSLLDYRLYIGTHLMANWMTRLRKLQEQQGILPPSPAAPRRGLKRTASENLAALHLPMEELHASYNEATRSPAGAAPTASIARSHSSAQLPSHFPDVDLNPRPSSQIPRPPIGRTATLGLSRSASLSRAGVSAHDFASSPLRCSLPPSVGRSCSSSSGLAKAEHRLNMQTAY